MKIDDNKMDLKILLNCTFGSASFLLSAYTIFALADFFSYNAADAADIPENGKKCIDDNVCQANLSHKRICQSNLIQCNAGRWKEKIDHDH